MEIRMVVADDSPTMLSAVRRVVQEEPRIKIVGETFEFTAIMQMMFDLRPEVFLFDLYMAQRRRVIPSFVKSQLAVVSHALAMSFANDEEAKALADSYGVALLDKMNLFTQLIPAVLQCRPLPLKLKRKAHGA
jgi:DNA-binding NarL/FixJ family response regulator